VNKSKPSPDNLSSERPAALRWHWLLASAMLLMLASLPLSRLAHAGLLAYPSDEPYTQEEMKELGGRGVHKEALEALNDLRELSGNRWTVLSASRSRSANRAAHGASQSQHLHGRAFDLRVPHWAREDFYRHAKAAGFTAFGWGNGSVHVDTRAQRGDWWTYDDQKNSRHVSGRKKMDFLYKAPESFRAERGLELTGAQGHWNRLKWDLMALRRDLGAVGQR